jgi:restriction system protein
MDLPWPAFETLIRDLFNKIGFDTYLTRPSRDGGVDCFAFLQQAVVGMKMVISAKQYSIKVPVEAVRDLASTWNAPARASWSPLPISLQPVTGSWRATPASS